METGTSTTKTNKNQYAFCFKSSFIASTMAVVLVPVNRLRWSYGSFIAWCCYAIRIRKRWNLMKMKSTKNKDINLCILIYVILCANLFVLLLVFNDIIDGIGFHASFFFFFFHLRTMTLSIIHSCLNIKRINEHKKKTVIQFTWLLASAYCVRKAMNIGMCVCRVSAQPVTHFEGNILRGRLAFLCATFGNRKTW